MRKPEAYLDSKSQEVMKKIAEWYDSFTPHAVDNLPLSQDVKMRMQQFLHEGGSIKIKDIMFLYILSKGKSDYNDM